MIYELRIYYMHPGRMQAINDRFATYTLDIFKKHGLRVTDFWEDTDPEQNRLFYVMEYENREERDRQWKAFQSDPEWQKVKSETEKEAPIVEKVESVYLKRVPYFTR